MQQVKGISYQKLADFGLQSIHISNDFCEAEIALQGGQILKFFSKTQQKDLLWLSELNTYNVGKAIRGGIPLCFPWFGTHAKHSDYPSHGFARNLVWTCETISQDESGHHLILSLTDNEMTRKYWDFAFRLNMHIHCGEQLKLEMHLSNLDHECFEYGFAWHSYFPAQTKIAQIYGLENENYIDQLNGNSLQIQKDEEISFHAELDRIYPETRGNFILKQNEHDSISIQSSAKSAVIWNPWIEKSARLTDVHDDAWQDFVCIECGQIATQMRQLNAGESVCYQLLIH